MLFAIVSVLLNTFEKCFGYKLHL